MRLDTVDLAITVVPGPSLSEGDRESIRELVNLAYEEDLTPIFRQLEPVAYILGTVGDSLVSHALWVTRWLQVARGPLLRTAYVELVATHPAHRRRGYAAAIMRRLQQEIEHYDIGGLSPFDVGYYARLGWEKWRGPLFERLEGSELRSPEDEEVMILRLPRTPDLDLDAPLSIEWREGEVW